MGHRIDPANAAAYAQKKATADQVAQWLKGRNSPETSDMLELIKQLVGANNPLAIALNKNN